MALLPATAALAQNVGIGTTTPQAPLHVIGLGRYTVVGGAALQLDGSSGRHVYLEYYPEGVANGRKAYLGYPNTGSHNFVLSNAYADGTIQLQPSGSAAFTLASSGYLGLGTTSPSARLTVQVSSDLDLGLRVSDGNKSNLVLQGLTGTNSGYQFLAFNGYYGAGAEQRFNTDKSRWRLGTDQRGATDQFFLDTYTGNTVTSVLSATTAGQVGVALSTSPTATLDVNGTTRLRSLTKAGFVTTDASGNLSSSNANVLPISDISFSTVYFFTGGPSVRLLRIVSASSTNNLLLETTGSSNVEGQELVIVNAQANAVIIFNDVSARAYQLMTLEQNQAARFIYVSGNWMREQ